VFIVVFLRIQPSSSNCTKWHFNTLLKHVLQARQLLEAETERVKSRSAHGDVATSTFAQVWDDCYAQVLFMPLQRKYTRASVVSKKDRIEAYEHKLNVCCTYAFLLFSAEKYVTFDCLQSNKEHMAKEARKAAKKEKNLKILLGGYQVYGFWLQIRDCKY